ncbi:MAG: SusC/RagA family TonB-linked outer membrane protein [Mediterranea sp.]|jgi:TonB-linked SusC/RagA family outer membrane protein|nr:SusC/RagA family TonB-linked outer membrane protein [Mediterranea sp.]
MKRNQQISLLLLLLLFTCSMHTVAQSGKAKQITMVFQKESLPSAFKRLEKVSGCKVSFIYDEISDYTTSGRVENASLEQTVRLIIGRHPLKYTINGEFVNITKVYPHGVIEKVRGTVLSEEDNLPVIGATVVVEGTNIRAITDVDGNFQLSNVPQSAKMRVSYVGLKAQVLTPSAKMAITLLSDTQALGEVVVQAGIIQRNKMGFTGSYNTVSADQLKSVGNTNIIQSLKSLDPSFVVIDNMSAGSNPNAMANIEVRGQSTMNITNVQDEANSTASANLPLFILDGFEASLQEVNDLDINRVKSVTILKDAGSTAIYGSKGANGVIVLETVRPEQGKVSIAYSGDFQLGWPSLGVYNMMNAAEKLEFERLSGRFTPQGSDVSTPAVDDGSDYLQQEYYKRLAWVQQGVDTDWLSMPVRTAFTQAHSVTISGGEKSILFDAGVNYKANPGVMKGSSRNVYGGNLKLVYRGIEHLSIMNNIRVQGTNGADGSWGSFSNFVSANPYYRPYNDDGTIPKYLDYAKTSSGDTGIIQAANPLYNATLGTRHDTQLFNLTNNTSIDWTIMQGLLLRGNLSLKHSTQNRVDFVDPRDTQFDSKTYDQKGSYKSAYTRSWSYSADIALNYLKSIKEHNLTFIGRYSVEERNNTVESLSAVGFPEGAVGYPSYANAYTKDSRPGYSTGKVRSLSFVGAFNYNYAYRYLVDVNYNLDGGTNFGRNKHFQSFWSLGLGWNVHKEAFAKEWHWLDELKLRGSYGSNGNQNVTVKTNSIYSYYVGSNIFGQSAYLSSVGNPNLEWQVVNKLSVGFDFAALKNNLKVTFDVYANRTDPQIIVLDQRPSTGVATYPNNFGYLKTKGLEFTVGYNIVNLPKEELLVNLRVFGSHAKATYGGFGNSLDLLSNAYKNEANSTISLLSLQKYEDGRSPSDIWAVRSLGIDPGTGREVYLKKDGTPTTDYSATDRVVVGNTEPDLQGVIGLTVRYKKLTLGANLRYFIGAQKYNTDLFTRVENITHSQIIYNQDKRALYDRWKNPGDVAEFKSIGLVTSAFVPVSSRFVQKNNYLRGESAKVTWNFTGEKWLKSVLLKDLSVSLSMSDLFELNTIKVERGIDYPFQRSVSMNVSARF